MVERQEKKATSQGRELKRGVNPLVKGPNTYKHCYCGSMLQTHET